MDSMASNGGAPGPYNERSKEQQKEVILKRKQDVFDSPDFDPIKLMNQLYPDEASLKDLDRFIATLKRQISSVDREIFDAVRAQGGAHTRVKADLEAAQQQIAELASHIIGIQQKAGESEVMVQEICKDIRKLDCAKKHLTNSITSLRRLAMLNAAITDLESLSARRDAYKRCANLLEATHQLMEYFQQYEDIPKVRALSKRLSTIEAQLQSAVIDDFKILMGVADVKVSPDNLDRLAAGCLVADALGPKVRDQLADWMCDREMNIYQQIFSMSAEASKLDRFERRFVWFRSRMEERKAEWAVFPESWRLPQTLCLTFCKITKAHLKKLLNEDMELAMGPGAGPMAGPGGPEAPAGPRIKDDIGPLIKAVVATNKFEKEMAAMFGGGVDQEDEEAGPGELEASDEMSASEARKRLEKFRQRMKAEEARRAASALSDRARAEAEAVRGTFEGSISDAFEPALGYYVREEEKELMNYMEQAVREEAEAGWRAGEEDTDGHILPSANRVFIKVQASMQRCVRMISRGGTLLALTQTFQRVLQAYCGALTSRLPRTASGATSVSPPYIGTDWYIRVPEDEERVVCRILRTAEFCRETVERLATAVKKDIKAQLADKLDMGEEESAFQVLSSQCMNVLVIGINTRLDAALQEMLRVRWDAIESPGDDSPYVTLIRKVLLDVAPRLGSRLDPFTLGFVAEKTGRMFVPRLAEHLQRCRRISDKGTLQLSIDMDSVRRALAEFPRTARPLGPEDRHPEFANFLTYVEREMGTIINTVKVLQAAPNFLVDTYMLLLPQGMQNANDFIKVCEMQGLPRALQQQLLAHFQHRQSGGDPSTAPAPITATAAGGGGGLGAAPALGAIANLGKAGVNNLAQLASNINLNPLKRSGGDASPMSASKNMFSRMATSGSGGSFSGYGGGGGPSGFGGHSRSGSSLTDAMANRTKDTFAKMGNFVGTGFAKIGTALGQQQEGSQHH